MRSRLTKSTSWAGGLFLVLFGVALMATPVQAGVGSYLAGAVVNALDVANTAGVNLLTLILNSLTWGVGKIVLVLIEMIIVPILGYNSWAQSAVIGVGWEVVRNLVNMFIVVVLLGLAIQTILGSEKVHWQKALPALILSTILVNFSRTICYLLLDISQQIMFVFVNGFIENAANNFANMLGLTDIGAVATGKYQAVVAGADVNAGEELILLGESFMVFILYLAVGAVMTLLALAFLLRIVILWVLVVLSPLAFFAGGVKGVFEFAGSIAADWWGRFMGALAMGPVLCFFMWLSMVAAGQGSIYQSAAFTQVDENEVVSNPFITLKSLTVESLTGTILALIFLIVGMKEANKFASKMDSMAGKLISEGVGKKALSYSAGLVPGLMTKAVGGKVKGWGAMDAFGSLGGAVDKGVGLTTSVGGNITAAGVRVGAGAAGLGARVGGPLGGLVTGIGSMVQRRAAGVGGGLVKGAEERRKKEREEAGKDVAQMDDQAFKSRADMLVGGRKAGQGSQQDMAIDEQMLLKLATDKKFRKKMEEEYEKDATNGKADFNRLLGRAYRATEDDKDDLLKDDAAKKNFASFKTANAHKISDDAEWISTDGKTNNKVRPDKFINEKKQGFDPADLHEDVLGAADGTMTAGQQEFVQAAKNKKLGKKDKDGREITQWDDIISGSGVSREVRARAEAVQAGLDGDLTRNLDTNRRTLTPAEYVTESAKSGFRSANWTPVTNSAGAVEHREANGGVIDRLIISGQLDVSKLPTAEAADLIDITLGYNVAAPRVGSVDEKTFKDTTRDLLRGSLASASLLNDYVGPTSGGSPEITRIVEEAIYGAISKEKLAELLKEHRNSIDPIRRVTIENSLSVIENVINNTVATPTLKAKDIAEKLKLVVNARRAV